MKQKLTLSVESDLIKKFRKENPNASLSNFLAVHLFKEYPHTKLAEKDKPFTNWGYCYRPKSSVSIRNQIDKEMGYSK